MVKVRDSGVCLNRNFEIYFYNVQACGIQSNQRLKVSDSAVWFD